MIIEFIIKHIFEVIAVIFSSLSLVISILSYNRYRPKIKVASSIGHLVGKDYDDKNTYLFFNAVNVCEKPITLNSLLLEIVQSLKLKKKCGFQIPYPTSFRNFPAKLNYGDKFDSWSTTTQIIKSLDESKYTGVVYIRCVFKDTAENKYKSNWVKFEINKYRTSL